MRKYNDVVKLFEEMDKIALDAAREFDTVVKREKLTLLDAAEKNVERFKQTGLLTLDIDINNGIDLCEAIIGGQGRHEADAAAATNRRSGSLKENIPENNTNDTARSLRSSTRPKRNAFVENTEMFALKLNNAIKESPYPNNLLQNVKLERLSEEVNGNHSDNVKNSKINNTIAKKGTNEMPPPLKPPIKQTRRRRVPAKYADLEARHIKVEQIDEEQRKRVVEEIEKPTSSSTPRDSDVQIHCEPIDTVNLIDSEEEVVDKPRTRGRTKAKKPQTNKDKTNNSDQDSSEGANQTVRVTRTKTRNAVKNNKDAESDESVMEKEKRLRSPSTEDDVKNKKGTRVNPKKSKTSMQEEEDIYASIYEDAISNADSVPKSSSTENKIGGVLNETVVLEQPKNLKIMNQTVVINKKVEENAELGDIMTDDEDVVVSPAKNKNTKLKQVFSPYENSPVKQRVQAFEKLRTDANNCELPPRMTRTKTKAKAKQQEEHNEENSNEVAQSHNANKIKQGAIPKLKSPSTKKGSIPVLKPTQTTPLSDNRLLITQSSTLDKYKQKANRANNSSSENMFMTTTTKPRSAVKASQVDLREKEMKRKQKEAEALSKKEAIIQAMTEERRRKREERQLKAQQTRDALEKDKQKVLESVERMKQEKLRQKLAEKEEKLLKQREEAARKRALAQKKAVEEKMKEEQRKLEQDMAAKKNVKSVPLYLKYEAPMLPTPDCYDSDDSNAGKPFSVPWQKKETLNKILKCMSYSNECKPYLYCEGPTTADLQEIFPTIEASKLKRTSSAIWNRSGILRLTSLVEDDE